MFLYKFINIVQVSMLKAAQIYAPQLAITCSQWTIETLEQGVKYVQS